MGTQIRAEQLKYQAGMAAQSLINGNFDVWQRGTSLAMSDATSYFLADRWNEYTGKDGGTLPTLTRSQQTQTTGDLDGSYYFTRLTTNGAGTSLGVNSESSMLQKIEYGTRYLCGNGKKVTVSFWAKSDIANKKIATSLYQNYGTSGSPSAGEFIKGEVFSLTSSWVKYTYTFTTNTLSGKTFGTAKDDYLQVYLWSMWGSTLGNARIKTSVAAETFVGSGNIDIAQVQLCAGDVALPFMPKSYEEELRACQRYFNVINGIPGYYISPSVISSTTTVIFSIPLQVEMRTAPTISMGGNRGTNWYFRDNSDNTNTTGTLVTSGSGTKNINVSFGSGTFTAAKIYTILLNDTTSNIAFSAEL